jgi:hypothetical protein
VRLLLLRFRNDRRRSQNEVVPMDMAMLRNRSRKMESWWRKRPVTFKIVDVSLVLLVPIAVFMLGLSAWTAL